MASLSIIQPDAAAGLDSYLRLQAPVANYGTVATTRIFASLGGDPRRAILKFDLSALAGLTADDIVRASIWLRATGNVIGSGQTIGCHRVIDSGGSTGDWEELQTSWNNRRAGMPWAAAGGDHDPTPEETRKIETLSYGENLLFTDFIITQLLKDWLAGTIPNRGVLLRGVGNEQSYDLQQSYFTSDSATEAGRPFLAVQTAASPIDLWCAACPGAGAYDELETEIEHNMLTQPERARCLNLPPALIDNQRPLNMYHRFVWANAGAPTKRRQSWIMTSDVPEDWAIDRIAIHAHGGQYEGGTDQRRMGVYVGGEPHWQAWYTPPARPSPGDYSTFTDRVDTLTVNPATGQPWTPAEVNGLEVITEIEEGFTAWSIFDRLFVRVYEAGLGSGGPGAGLSGAEAILRRRRR